MTGEELNGYVGLFDRFNLRVVDSRRPDEFRGAAMSRDSKKPGRIPGAVNLMFTQVLTGGKEYKELKAASEIQKIFDANGLTRDKHLTFTCVSGCFGTTLYFAARLLGYQNVSIYDGGWIERSQKNYPVEVDGKISTSVPADPAVKEIGKPAPGKKESPKAPVSSSPTTIAPAPTPAPGGGKKIRDEGC
jgi:rhodanese-related sulfurtransferase